MNRMRKVTSGEGPGRRTVGILEGKAVKAVHQSNKQGQRLLFPSSQRRARSASPLGRSLKRSYAERSEGDGVAGSAKCLGRPEHPGASRHPFSARRGICASNSNTSVCPFTVAKRHDCSVVRREILPRDCANVFGRDLPI